MSFVTQTRSHRTPHTVIAALRQPALGSVAALAQSFLWRSLAGGDDAQVRRDENRAPGLTVEVE